MDVELASASHVSTSTLPLDQVTQVCCSSLNRAGVLLCGGPRSQVSLFQPSASSSTTCSVWRFQERKRESSFSSPVNCLAWVSETIVALSLFQSPHVILWKVETDSAFKLTPTLPPSGLQAIQSLCSSSDKRIAMGSDKGTITVSKPFESLDFQDLQHVDFVIDLQLKGEKSHVRVESICFAETGCCVVAGLSTGQVAILDRRGVRRTIDIGEGSVTCLKTGLLGETGVMLAGMDTGAALLWTLPTEEPAEQKDGGQPKAIAWLGNSSREEISALQIINVGKEQVVLIGDDGGELSMYSVKDETTFRLAERDKYGSPIVLAELQDKDTLLIVTCEQGVHKFPIDHLMQGQHQGQPETQVVKRMQQDEVMHRRHDDYESEEDEEDELLRPTPPPVPRPSLARNYDSEDESSESQGSISQRDDSESEELKDGDSQVDDDDSEELEEGESEEEEDVESEEEGRDAPKPRPYPSRAEHQASLRTCYNGFIDQDVPPLPLSQYAEPSLNSSELIRKAIEKIQLRGPQDAAKLLDPKQVEKIEKLAATKALTIPKGENLYQDLVPIRTDVEPVVVSRPMNRKLAEKLKNRKTIMERQQEVIEQHRLERQSRELEKESEKYTQRRQVQSLRGEDDASESEQVHPGSASPNSSFQRATSSSPDDVSEPSDKSIDGLQQQSKGGTDWFQSYKSPWTKPEFYLTKYEDGRVGFHNFRSLAGK